MEEDGTLDPERRRSMARLFNKGAYDEAIKETIEELFTPADAQSINDELNRMEDEGGWTDDDSDGEGKV